MCFEYASLIINVECDHVYNQIIVQDIEWRILVIMQYHDSFASYQNGESLIEIYCDVLHMYVEYGACVDEDGNEEYK